MAASSRHLVIWRPLAMLLLGVAVGAGTLILDRAFSLELDVIDVATARALLATLAGTMVTATVVVFWIRGMIVGTHSGHLPSRVLTSYLGDSYQQWVMGFMIGVFGFLVAVLFGLPEGSDGSIAAPLISVAVAVVLTVVALLTIIQSIDTGARSMHEQRVMMRIVDEGLRVIDRHYPEHANGAEPPRPRFNTDPQSDVVIWGAGIGWVWSIDDAAILRALPPGSICHRLVRVGDFVSPASELCRVALPPGSKPDGVDRSQIEAAFGLMDTRSPHHDIGMAIRSIVDVALSGLGTGSADRTTAREAIPHLGVIVRALLLREGPPQAWVDGEDRWLLVEGEPEFSRYTNLAFDDLRHANPDPITVQTLLSTIDDLTRAAEATGQNERAELLTRHARLLVNQIRDHTADTDELRWVAGAHAAEHSPQVG